MMNFFVNILWSLVSTIILLFIMNMLRIPYIKASTKIVYPSINFIVMSVLGYTDINMTVRVIIILSIIYSIIINDKKINIEEILMIFACGFFIQAWFFLISLIISEAGIESMFYKASIFAFAGVFFLLIFNKRVYIGKALKAIIYKEGITRNVRTKTFLVIALSCYIIIFIISIIIRCNNSETLSRFIYFLSSLMSFFVLVNIINRNLVIENLSKSIKYKEEQYSKLKKYTETIEAMSVDLKKFKHDYANILRTLYYYIENDDFESLKKYYKKELFPQTDNIINKDNGILYLKNIKNLSLKGILFSKISEAKSKHIDIMLDAREEIGEFKINIIDLCRIVGILMDNAIEATNELEDKKILVGIVNLEGEKIIVIENTCSKALPPIYKMFEEGFSTKGSGRGMGLSIVKSIEGKYSNVFINTEMDGNIFRQEIVVSDEVK